MQAQYASDEASEIKIQRNFSSVTVVVNAQVVLESVSAPGGSMKRQGDCKTEKEERKEITNKKRCCCHGVLT